MALTGNNAPPGGGGDSSNVGADYFFADGGDDWWAAAAAAGNADIIPQEHTLPPRNWEWSHPMAQRLVERVQWGPGH